MKLFDNNQSTLLQAGSGKPNKNSKKRKLKGLVEEEAVKTQDKLVHSQTKGTAQATADQLLEAEQLNVKEENMTKLKGESYEG